MAWVLMLERGPSDGEVSKVEPTELADRKWFVKEWAYVEIVLSWMMER